VGVGVGVGLGVGAGDLGGVGSGGGDVGFTFYSLCHFFPPCESVVIAPRYSPRHFRWDELKNRLQALIFSDPPRVKEETDGDLPFRILNPFFLGPQGPIPPNDPVALPACPR